MTIAIGTEYRTHEFNCAHFVAEWYREHGICDEIPTSAVFDRQFVVWMRKHFTEISKPCDHSLVLMVHEDGSYHVGVYYKYRIYHNFKPFIGNGSVCKWVMSAVQKYYKEVRFYKWLQ